jgi:hypothetical protein
VTDLQDEILDRLVAAPMGVDWPSGPLTSAAHVISGTRRIRFGATDNDRGAKAEIARRLGYPVLLCEAIQGGNRGLAAEDDRRAFAMTIFSTIPLGGAVKRMSVRAQGLIAVRLADRTHRYVCAGEGCPLSESLQLLAEADEARTLGRVNKALAAVCSRYSEAVHSVEFLDIRVAASSLQRSVYSAYRAGCALRRGWHVPQGKGSDAWASVRESVRLAASELGVGEAVDCCLDIARACGMPVAAND